MATHPQQRSGIGRCRRRAGGAAGRGFTLIELSVVIIIIALLASLGVVSAARAVRYSRVAAERALVVSLRNSVEQFKATFGGLPPLVDDHRLPDGTPDGVGHPVMPNPTTGYLEPQVRDAKFLSSEPGTDPDAPRYSVYSLTYYLMGALDTKSSAASDVPIDGVAGPGFTKPDPETGRFSRRGETINAFMDPGTRGRLVVEDFDNGRITFVDRWTNPETGKKNPIRFYRWRPQHERNGANAGQVDQYMVPRTVGDPNTDPELRTAEYAIVSLGPDCVTDAPQTPAGYDRRPLPTAGRTSAEVDATAIDKGPTADNIVEVGR